MPSAAEDNEAALAYNRAAAKRGGMMKMLKVESAEEAQQLANKAIQKQLDVWKGVLLANAFWIFPLIIVLLLINIELLLPLFYQSWKIPLWRRFTYFVADLIAFAVIVIVVGSFGYISEHPDEACQALGGAWSIAGKIGGCSVAKEMFGMLLNL